MAVASLVTLEGKVIERSERCSEQMTEKQKKPWLHSLISFLGWESTHVPVWSGKSNHSAAPRLLPDYISVCFPLTSFSIC